LVVFVAIVTSLFASSIVLEQKGGIQ
jgi:hypothetical protein